MKVMVNKFHQYQQKWTITSRLLTEYKKNMKHDFSK
jgi:hypothetical protein